MSLGWVAGSVRARLLLGHRLDHQLDGREVVAGAGAVAVDRVEQDLAGAELDRAARPGDRIGAAVAAIVYLPLTES